MGFSTSDGTAVDRVEYTKVVGLTGGMGSGKSVVSHILRCLGHPVYDADAAAKRLYHEDPALLQAVTVRFGPEVVDAEGRLDRGRLAALVFADPEALAALNALVHPAVARDFKTWRSHQEARGHRWVFREAAILFESGSDRDCHRTWGVAAPQALRVDRVRRRSGWSKSDILARMARQWSQEEVMSRCDARIDNGGSEPLVPQVLQLVSELGS
ncbi:MAG: dephospho-CoA kinase [Flavobacteriales bacterium]